MLKRLIKNGFSPESVRRIKNLRARAFRRNTVKGLRGNIIERCDTYMENCRIEFHGIGNTVILGGGKFVDRMRYIYSDQTIRSQLATKIN